jgi:hypothetical protein
MRELRSSLISVRLFSGFSQEISRHKDRRPRHDAFENSQFKTLKLKTRIEAREEVRLPSLAGQAGCGCQTFINSLILIFIGSGRTSMFLEPTA